MIEISFPDRKEIRRGGIYQVVEEIRVACPKCGKEAQKTVTQEEPTLSLRQTLYFHKRGPRNNSADACVIDTPGLEAPYDNLNLDWSL